MYTEQRRMIVLYELGEDNRYEEQARWAREEDVPPEFEAIMPAEDWEEMSDDRIINMVSGPYVVAAYVDEEGADSKELAEMECPPPTQDVKLNTQNRNAAIQADHIQYGPLNVDEPAGYWDDIAEFWGTSTEAAKESKCANCVAFDISDRMDDCMPGSTSDDDGRLGYCHMHKFKCHSARSCRTWAKGGPIEDDETSYEWQGKGKEMADPGDDNWVPYRGERGGRGFRNTRTDEVVYQGDERFERIRGMVREEFDEREDLEEGEEEADFTPEPADAQTFLSGVKKFVDDNPDYAPMLTIHDAEELEDHEILTSPDGGAGISISPEGDIQNLFSNRGTKGDALILLRRAIQEGGRTLDCYDGYLYELYSDFGFRVTGRIEFNREFADERWNYDRFNEPDVLHMHFDPDGEDDDTYYGGTDWDSLKDQSRQRAVANVPKNMSDTDTETIDELNQRLLDDLREKKGEEWVEQHAELIEAQMDMVGML
jgi:hypothetical protein